MDLTIPLENITLNIRVAVLIKKEDGFVLEKGKEGYYYPVGGRIKVNETSEEAAKREIFEELGVVVEDFKLKAVVELFFGPENNRVQEICFVYSASIPNDLKISDEFSICTLEEIETIDFRPQAIKEVMRSKTDNILHLTMKED